MPKSTRNTGKPWTTADVRELHELARENTPTRVIGLKLGRTAGAVYQRASREDISLRPTTSDPTAGARGKEAPVGYRTRNLERLGDCQVGEPVGMTRGPLEH